MSYNGCKIKNYSRINSNTGAGFILTRLADGAHSDMTRREVYEGTHYAKRFGPGYHSSIWAKLLEDGLIESDGGFEIVKNGQAGGFGRWRSFTFKRAKSAAGQAPIYRLTDKGWRLYNEFCAKRKAVLETKKEFCKRNGIQFGTGKPLPCPLPYTHATNTPVDPTRTPESGPEALDKLEHFDPDLAERLDNIIRDLQELRDSL